MRLIMKSHFIFWWSCSFNLKTQPLFFLAAHLGHGLHYVCAIHVNVYPLVYLLLIFFIKLYTYVNSESRSPKVTPTFSSLPLLYSKILKMKKMWQHFWTHRRQISICGQLLGDPINSRVSGLKVNITYFFS